MTAEGDRELVIRSRPGVRILFSRLLGTSYEDARAEAHEAGRRLGLLFGRPRLGSDPMPVGDYVRRAYVGGWTACETRLDSPEMADAIATALETPTAVLEQLPNESDHRHQIRAVRQVVAYGLAKR